MRWSNVFVIFRREVRDQLRDRRTLFMIFVLPMLLYPLLGIGAVQLASSFEQKPRTVIIVGPENLPAEPPLLNAARDGFDRALFDTDAEARRLLVRVEDAEGPWGKAKYREQATHGGLADVVVPLPTDLKTRVERKEPFDLPVVFGSA